MSNRGSGRLKSGDKDAEESSSLRPPTRPHGFGSTSSTAASYRSASIPPLELVRADHSAELAEATSHMGSSIQRGAHRSCEGEQAPRVGEEGANVLTRKGEDAAAADEDCFDANSQGQDSAFVAHVAEAFPFEGASQAAGSDDQEAGQSVEVAKKSLGTCAILDGGLEANQQGEESLSQLPSAPRSRSPQREEISRVMEEAKEEEEEVDMYDVRVQESAQRQETSTPPSEQTAGRENVSNPGAFAVQGQTIEQRTLGMLSPIPEPEQTLLPEDDDPIQSPVDDSTPQIPVATTVASDQVEAEVNTRLKDLARTSVVAETVVAAEVMNPATGRKMKRDYFVACLVLVMVVIGVAVGLSVGLTRSSDPVFVERTPSPTFATNSPSLSPTEVWRPTLEKVVERGKLICGFPNIAPYFSVVNDETGVAEGFEYDLCRAVAAAVFGDADARVEPFVFQTGNQKFESLANRSVELVVSSATHTIERDVYEETTKTGFSFTAPYLYNGLLFTGVPPFGACADELISSSENCRELLVCVSSSASYFPLVQDLLPRPNIFPSEDFRQDFIDGNCNAMAGEITLLSETQIRDKGYEGEYEIGTNVFSKEPLAMVTRDDDPEWSDFVNWVFQALLAAEEQGITQYNPSAQLPTVSVFGNQFENMFINAVGSVGNFGEIYNRHLGDVRPRQVLDEINTNGSTGLLYSHSFAAIDRVGPGPSVGGTLEKIASRGLLRCGISVRNGFGAFDPVTAQWSGLDADYCRALSSSIFNGTSGNVEFVNLTLSQDRFDALANGEIDVLSGGRVNLVTDVLDPSSERGYSFSQPYFYNPPTGVSWNLTSREARALATRQDDPQWSDFVYWLVASTFYAEEKFISQMQSDRMPAVNLFGLSYQSMFQDAISAVGHYGEMYARNVEEFVPRSGRNLPNIVPLGPQHFPLPGI